MSLKYELRLIPSRFIILVGFSLPEGPIQTPSHGLQGQTPAEAEPTLVTSLCIILFLGAVQPHWPPPSQ